MTDDDGRQQEFIEDRGIDGSQSPAVGSSQFSILLHPAGLDASVRDDKDSLFQSLLEFGDELLVSGGEEDFVSSVGDVDKNKRFVLFVGDFLNFVDDDSCGELSVFSIQVVSSFDESSTYLVLKVGKIATLDTLGSLEDIVHLSGFGHCGKSDIY